MFRSLLLLGIVGSCFGIGCSDERSAPQSPLLSDLSNTSNPSSNASTSGSSCIFSAEVCDQHDNDCDDHVDEGLTESDVNNCGACGNMCALANAEAICQAGACIIFGCLDGYIDADGQQENGCESLECEEHNAGVEICDDIDNDCDDHVDEDFLIGQAPEHCLGCNQPCRLEHASAVCSNATCAIDQCDDDWVDADGVPDNGCESPRCELSNAGIEICDERDNDCDGLFDEGFDLYSVQTCGQCDRSCAWPNAVADCDQGQCLFVDCEDGWVDLNASLDDDGCEYLCEAEVLALEDIPCDGQDNDCDGDIDEDSEEGADCRLSEMLSGTLACLGGELRCAVDPSDSPIALCGPIAGALSAAHGPYRVSCEELSVRAGDELYLEAGVELISDFNVSVRLLVHGQLISEGALWTGVSLHLSGASSTTLRNDTFTSVNAGHPQVTISGSELSLNAQGVTLNGGGRAVTGIQIDEAPPSISWRDGRFMDLALGVEHRAAAALALTDTSFSNVARAIVLTASASNTPALQMTGGSIFNDTGAAAVGLDLMLPSEFDVELDGVSFEQRAQDAAVKLDPDLLPELDLVNTDVVGDAAPTIQLAGDLDVLEELTLSPIDAVLPNFSPVGQVAIEAGSSLIAGPAVGLRGQDEGALIVRGHLNLTETYLEDLSISVEPSGAASLEEITAVLSAESMVPCLITAHQGGQLLLDAAHLIGQLHSVGLCLEALSSPPSLVGSKIEGFGHGVILRDTAAIPISNITLVDNAVGISVEGAVAPLIVNNTFNSTAARQIVAIQFNVGSEPGGQVSDNTFSLDIGDLVYHLDPDNLSINAGTRFGSNTWLGPRPESFLLSGTQTSPEVHLTDVHERETLDGGFLTIQVLGDVEIAEGSLLHVAPPNAQIWTLQGLIGGVGDTILRVHGELTFEGPGIIVAELPIFFEPDSLGTLSSSTLISNRAEYPIVHINNADPTIGGPGSAAGCSFSGSNRLDGVGVSVTSSMAMCSEAARCPFVAENIFRNLAIGIEISDLGDFRGVNDFDDTNPAGDTVPINVQRP